MVWFVRRTGWVDAGVSMVEVVPYRSDRLNVFVLMFLGMLMPVPMLFGYLWLIAVVVMRVSKG